MIALHPSLPARSVKELIALARSRPGQINFGSAGNGSPNHPKELVTRLNNDVVASLGGADVKERLASLGAEPAPMFLESFGRHVREEIAKWAKVVKESGAKVD